MVWLVLMAAESVHGAFRTILLVPAVGDFRARQISVFTGSVLIVLIVCLFVRWLRIEKTGSYLAIGFAWLLMTLVFEIALGRLAFGYPWDRVLSDFNILEGGLLPIGLAVLALSPLIAARLRGIR